jgi:hypothetical protein
LVIACSVLVRQGALCADKTVFDATYQVYLQ